MTQLIPFISLGFIMFGAIFIMLISHKQHHKMKDHIIYALMVLGIALLLVIFGWQDEYTFRPLKDILDNAIIFDTYASFFDILLIVGSIFTILISRDYFINHKFLTGEFLALFLFAVFGMMLLTHANDFLVALVALEIASIAIYIMIDFNSQKPIRIEAMFKYLLFGSVIVAFYLLGLALIYLQVGSLNLEVVGEFISKNGQDNIVVIGLTLVSIIFLFKIAAFPFSNWVLDIYSGAPYPIAAFMASIFKISVFAFFIRLFIQHLTPIEDFWDNMLYILIILTLTYGTFMAVIQRSMKRMLAASSIVHAGYVLLGFIALDLDYTKASYAIIFYLIAYAIASLGSFGLSAYLSSKEGVGKIYYEDFAGLAHERPYMSAMMSIFMFSLAGIPGTIGFIAKFYIFDVAIEKGFLALAVLGIVATIISIYYYLRLVVRMYFYKPTGKIQRPPLKRISPLVIGVLATLVVWGGIGDAIVFLIPIPDIDTLLNLAEKAIDSLFLR
jgi:NADH-quinone oxidoreductase subunit N